MAKALKFKEILVIHGVLVHARVMWCNDWEEYISQVRVDGGEWCNDYCTTCYDDARQTLAVLQETYAKRQAIARITSHATPATN